MILFIARLVANKISFHFRDLFLCEMWNVAIVKAPVQIFLNPESSWPDPVWLPKAGRGKYRADPFGYVSEGKLNMLFEDFDYSHYIGKLSAFQLETPGLAAVRPKEVLNTAYHLAYPFMISYNGECYCMPETANNLSLDLYKFDPNSQSLTYRSTLLTGIAAVDATLFNYKGLWWLFFTKKGSTNTDLNIWYSENIFGTYRPHANNPVKTDIQSARPAGTLFIHNGELYRPAQNCSGTYGGSISINRVTSITTTEFKEELCNSVKPYGHHKWKKGLHTLCSAGEYTLIDGKRHAFVLASFWYQLKHKTMRIVRKNTGGQH